MRHVAVLCLLLPLALRAQIQSDSPAAAPPQPRSSLKVEVPLLLEDRKGRPVEADASTLTLTEDGAPQPILSVAPAAALPLTVGLVVDTSAGQRAETPRIKAAAADFIRSLMAAPAAAGPGGAPAAKGGSAPAAAPRVQGFVAHFDREVELLQDRTGDRERLLQGIALLDSPEPVQPGGGAAGEAGGPAASTSLLYDALYLSATEITGRQPGRRVLILVSGGEDAGSKETLRSAIDALQENGTLVYAIFVKGQSKRNEDRESQPGGQRRSGIGFPFPGSGYPGGGYPGSGYPGGGYPGGGYPGSGSSGGNAPSGGRQPQHAPAPRGDARRILEDIAAPTGGRVFEMGGKQDAAAIFAMIQNDIAHGSILAFNPDRRGARPGFHSLRIETRQKDIRVDAPDGFYVKEPE